MRCVRLIHLVATVLAFEACLVSAVLAQQQVSKGGVFKDEPGARAKYDAMNQALRKARSLYLESEMRRGFEGVEVSRCIYKLWMKKPNYARIEVSVDGMLTGVLVGDGENFWFYWPNGRPLFSGEHTAKYASTRWNVYLQSLTFQQDSGTQALKILLDELCYLRTTIARVTKGIRVLSTQQRYEASVRYLVSIPGISTIGAMILLTELIDIHRFRSLNHLASYVGLVPGEHSSGEQEITTGISRRRNPFLRGVLIECAWVAARKDPALLLAFTKLSKRMAKNNAIIRIAHKLLNRIRYVLLHQQYHQTSVVATEAA